MPFAGKADPRNGRGCAKGAPNAGRPANEHRLWCAALISDVECESQVLAILQDKNHPAFATMWRAVSDRAYGKASQPLEHSGAVTQGVVLLPATLPVDEWATFAAAQQAALAGQVDRAAADALRAAGVA